MKTQINNRERGFRAALAVVLAIVVWRLGFNGPTVDVVIAIGASVIGLAAAVTAILGRCVNVLGLAQPYAVGFLAARLFVGWEFAHAGWEKLTGDGWVGSSAGTAIGGFLKNATSPAMTSGEHPAVPGWFADLTSNVFIPHAEIMSYAIVFGELAVGIGLIVGLFTRTAAFFAITMNLAFLLGGSTGGGLNPEMLVAGMAVLAGTEAVYALSIDAFRRQHSAGASKHRLHLHKTPAAAPTA